MEILQDVSKQGDLRVNLVSSSVRATDECAALLTELVTSVKEANAKRRIGKEFLIELKRTASTIDAGFGYRGNSGNDAMTDSNDLTEEEVGRRVKNAGKVKTVMLYRSSKEALPRFREVDLSTVLKTAESLSIKGTIPFLGEVKLAAGEVMDKTSFILSRSHAKDQTSFDTLLLDLGLSQNASFVILSRCVRIALDPILCEKGVEPVSFNDANICTEFFRTVEMLREKGHEVLDIDDSLDDERFIETELNCLAPTRKYRRLVLFGPSGVGKSTLVEKVNGVDLEQIPSEKRIDTLMSGSGVFAAADINPNTFNDNETLWVVLTMDEETYQKRRIKRDAKEPDKAAQPSMSIEDFKLDQSVNHVEINCGDSLKATEKRLRDVIRKYLLD